MNGKNIYTYITAAVNERNNELYQHQIWQQSSKGNVSIFKFSPLTSYVFIFKNVFTLLFFFPAAGTFLASSGWLCKTPGCFVRDDLANFLFTVPYSVDPDVALTALSCRFQFDALKYVTSFEKNKTLPPPLHPHSPSHFHHGGTAPRQMHMHDNNVSPYQMGQKESNSCHLELRWNTRNNSRRAPLLPCGIVNLRKDTQQWEVKY